MIRKEKIEELESYINEYKIVSMTKKDSPTFLTINKYEVLLNNGKIINREQILKNGKDGNAVAILPITIDNDVILVIQPRVFTKRGVGIELPAGYVENNENYIDSAYRELIEETGYNAQDIKLVTKSYQDQGCSKAIIYGLIAFNCKKIQKQNLDKDEYIRYFKCKYEEALELADEGYINDTSSLLLLEKSKQYIKRR